MERRDAVRVIRGSVNVQNITRQNSSVHIGFSSKNYLLLI